MLTQDLPKATNALTNWFQSQSISPYDAVMVAEMFLAQMAVANSSSPEDMEEKFRLFLASIREMVDFLIRMQANAR